MKVEEIRCKSAIGKCGFPGGGWGINPYVGCEHACVYCYARFMRRFTGHKLPWGSFIDIRANIADVLKKQLKSQKYKQGRIYIGTVTDPYQPIEKKYRLTRKILKILVDYQPAVSILTKSSLVSRDIDLLQQIKDVDVSFTINTLDKKWQKLTEPNSSSVKQRFQAATKLIENKIKVFAMIGPLWPFFTDTKGLFSKFNSLGISHVFAESFNTVGGNWSGVEKVLAKHYPKLLVRMKQTMFDLLEFEAFYQDASEKIDQLSREYKIPTTVYFRPGHAGKFKP